MEDQTSAQLPSQGHWVRTLRRTVLALSVVVICLLAACSPEQVGVVGLSITEDGEVLGVMTACRGGLDGASLHAEVKGATEGEGDSKRVARWEFPSVVGKEPMVWKLDSEHVETPATESLSDPGAWRGVELVGWSEDNWRTTRRFAPAEVDVAGLVPGQVLFPSGDGTQVSTSLSAFTDTACRSVP